ncbi:MAG TPA: tripartite tricarboxylate transporter substrate binding protein [Burkholderiales bacterium]|nr:tripartite tricarboxylate transporter substrate binding protein [Burkholderiales bacterium]
MLLLAVAASAAHAAPYPEKPIRLVVAFAAGGSIDLLARLFAQKLSEGLGQQMVVDNRPGAGGNLSAEIVARSAPDGYTIYLCAPSLVVNAALYSKIAYDPIQDFTPVTLLASVQNVLVAFPGFAVKSVKELITLAKSKPGRINYGSTGSGSSGHLVMEMFRSQAGIEMTHVPYKTIGQTTADLISGQVSLWFPTIPGVLPHIKGGRMRALAVAGARRSPALPEIPTVADAAALAGFDATTWYAVLTPAGTPKTIIAKLNTEFLRVLRLPDVQERLAVLGVESIGSTPVQAAAHLRRELSKWAKVVRAAGVRAD